METFSALLAICAGNSPVTGEFPPQRPVTRSFDVFFDLRLNKRLSKQSRRRWFETPSHPLWRHCNDLFFRAELSPRGKTEDAHPKPRKSTTDSPTKTSKTPGALTSRTNATDSGTETASPPKSILKVYTEESDRDTKERKVSRARTTIQAPTRRERVKQMQRNKSISVSGGVPKKVSKSGKGKPGEAYTLEDAAAVYYATIIREKSAIEDQSDARTVATPDSQAESSKEAPKERMLNKREVGYDDVMTWKRVPHYWSFVRRTTGGLTLFLHNSFK